MKELNQTKDMTAILKKEFERKDVEYKNELSEEKALKERQEIVNKRLHEELDELKKSEDTSKKVTADKMKKIESEFVEKQKIALQLERKQAIEGQEKALQEQQKTYEKELAEDRQRISELQAWKKKQEEEK